MIGFITGKIHDIGETSLIIDVNGVGYEVFLSKNELQRHNTVGTNVKYEIYTHVAEGILQLFGFVNKNVKAVFLNLLSVSGIGPKSALNILSETSLESLLGAIVGGDIVSLTKISGIGKKTAERLILELKDKFKNSAHLPVNPAANDNLTGDDRLNDVSNALLSLGYAEFQIKKFIKDITVGETDTVQTLLKKSLAMAQR